MLELGSTRCKHNTRWQYLSRMKNRPLSFKETVMWQANIRDQYLHLFSLFCPIENSSSVGTPQVEVSNSSFQSKIPLLRICCAGVFFTYRTSRPYDQYQGLQKASTDYRLGFWVIIGFLNVKLNKSTLAWANQNFSHLKAEMLFRRLKVFHEEVFLKNLLQAFENSYQVALWTFSCKCHSSPIKKNLPGLKIIKFSLFHSIHQLKDKIVSFSA